MLAATSCLFRTGWLLASGFALCQPLLAQDQTVSGNLGVSGVLDVYGNALNLGSWPDDTTRFGLNFTYAEDASHAATLTLTATRPATAWLWQQAAPNNGAGSVPQMSLSAGNTLTLFNQASPTPGAAIVLDPSGTSHFNDSLFVYGIDNRMPNQSLSSNASILTLGLADGRYLLLGTALSYGDHSVASGGAGSTSLGGYNTASGEYSTATGYGTTASGSYSVSSGWGSYATGLSSVAMGQSSTASGWGALSLGGATNSSFYWTTSLGFGTTASWVAATAMGEYTTASSWDALSTGYASLANAWAATSMGIYSNASGEASLAAGDHTIANGQAQVAVGRYNVAQGIGPFNPTFPLPALQPTDQLFIIGNGTDEAHRSDALTTRANGDTTVAGKLVVNVLQDAAHLPGSVGEGDIFVVGNGTYSNVTVNDANGNPTTAHQAGATFSVKQNGTVTVAGDLSVNGVLRVLPQGDLSMGEFTAQPSPAP